MKNINIKKYSKIENFVYFLVDKKYKKPFARKNKFFRFISSKFFKKLRGLIPIYPYILCDKDDQIKIGSKIYFYNEILRQQKNFGLLFYIIYYIFSKRFRFISLFKALIYQYENIENKISDKEIKNIFKNISEKNLKKIKEFINEK